KIKTGPEHLEGLPVVQTPGDDRAEHRRKRMPGNAQPVSPGAVLPGLIHQALADIEDHGTDHAHHPTAADRSAWLTAGAATKRPSRQGGTPTTAPGSLRA